MRVYKNKKEQYYTDVGEYRVIGEGKRFFGVYRNGDENKGKLLTSRTSWRSAVKIAKLLNEAYTEGEGDLREKIRDERYI